jgi:hypothetical protein
MLGLPAELECEVIARLSWAARKSLAQACKAARAACFERVGALRWEHHKDAPPGVDVSGALPSATRLALGGLSGGFRAFSPAAFLDANHALLAQLERIDVLDELHNFEDLLLATLAQRCPRLTSLQLPPGIFSHSWALRHLAALTQLTRLELHLDNCSYSAFISAAHGISGLRELSLHDVRLKDTGSLRGTTTFQRLTRLEFCSVNIAGGVDFGCLSPLLSLRALCFYYCHIEPHSLSRLTQLASLTIIDNNDDNDDFELPTSGIASLTNLTSLDIGSSAYLDLDQGQLRRLQRVLGGLDKLALGCFTGAQDAALLASMGCTDLRFRGFQDCAAPAGGASLLPNSVVRLQLTRPGALCPLVLRQAGLTSLSLARGSSDAECRSLAGAFPQLRALRLSWPLGASQPAGITAAGLAHLCALRHLQQLSLVRPFPALQPAELRALAGITSMRRLVISMWDVKHVREVEEMLAALAAGARGLRQVLLTVGRSFGMEALQAECDRVVAGCGRQELAMQVRRVCAARIRGEDAAWGWMLALPAVG